MNTPTRREILATSAVILGLPLVSAAEEAAPQRKLKVIVAGGHPDDPESGAGGTMARYADLGHDVVALYLTRGEAGIKGKSHDEAARIRSAESAKACEILKSRPLFAGQIDGATEVNAARYADFKTILLAEKPDVVFTHWPIDTHRDHRAVSYLTYDAWLASGKAFSLYYFEVIIGSQTQLFHPTHYVDITATEARKRAACFAHESQDPPHFWNRHDLMNQFRGIECGKKFAEGFVHHGHSPLGTLP
jgi:LmbE family N-acetylglucosaminyl deacetylase